MIDLPTTMMDLPEGQSCVFELVNNILIEVMGAIAGQEQLTITQRQAEVVKVTLSVCSQHFNNVFIWVTVKNTSVCMT